MRAYAVAAGSFLLGLLIALGPAPADETSDARALSQKLAEQSRLKEAGLTFEQFKATVFKEPFAGGKYIVNGDVGIANDKQLREFYESSVVNAPPAPDPDESELIINEVGGLDDLWSVAERHSITYCVTGSFGTHYGAVVAAMADAAAAWQAVSDVAFVHLGALDANCTDSTPGVVFDVRPVAFGKYYARSFFPHDTRSDRNVLIDASSFQLDPAGKLTLAGIIRHELGHTLGARHEHTRPESGKCFEDSEWRPITNYDALSVMHYPQCNGLGDWSLQLTAVDKSGMACVYGPAAGFAIDPTICKPMQATTVETFEAKTVAEGDSVQFGPFRVQPNTSFVAELKGAGATPGDPDLYVAFDRPVATADYDCRPYLDGPDESCSVDTPAGSKIAAVMVHGYASATFDLTVRYIAP